MRFGTQTQPEPSPELTLTPEASPTYQPEPTPVYSMDPEPVAPSIDIDWVSVALGLLALIAVGGLIPFWMWVYFVYNPLNR
jgi:serine/threonine-protein kinase